MEDVKTQLRGHPSEETFAWVVAAVGARARLDSWMVAQGGSACAIHAVDVLDAGGMRHPLLLKRFFREQWLARDPDLVEREARHLTLLAQVDLPIPRLVAADPRAEDCDLPAVLMTRLPGRPELLPSDVDVWLRSLVEPLGVLHALPESVWSGFPPYQSYNDLGCLEVPRWTRRPGVWERVIERLQGTPPASASHFVHRDYHPGNLLWSQGHVTGVLDFPNSSHGPAAVDLGHCRLNLAQLHGPDVADRFLEVYESVAPGSLELDPYWDLLSLAGCLPGPEGVYWGWRNLGVTHLTAEICWRRLDEFAERLLARL